MKKIIYFIIFWNLSINAFSQLDSVVIGNITPGGKLDTIFDQNGNKHLLKNYSLNSVNSVSCSAGYFNLVYAPNSGFDNLTNPVHIAKRDILCKLSTDISNFISSPLSAPSNTTRVNILIEDPTNALAANPSFLGGAIVFYVAAAAPSSANPGIVDTEVYKTVISGVDS